MTALPPARPVAWGFALALAVAALWPAPLHLPLNNPNEGVRVFAAAALVEHRTFAIDAVVKRWGYIDDKARHKGRLYSSKAPLPSLLAAAAYAVVHPLTGDLSRPALTRLCRFAGDTLPSLGLALLLLHVLRRRLAREAPLVVAAVVVGTGVLGAMQVLSGHAIAALATAAMFVLALEDTPRGRQHALLGALGALAVGAEYPAALAAVGLAALALVRVNGVHARVRALAFMALGAAPLAAVVAASHTAMFGAPWRTGYSFLENKTYEALVTPGFFGIGMPHLDAFVTSFFSFELGLFVFGPVALLGVIALLSPRVPRSARVAALVLVIAYALFISGFRGWRGGWSVGPRYIAELWGALAVVCSLWIEASVGRVRQSAVFALSACAGAGLVTAGLAGAWFPHLPDAFSNPMAEFVLPLVSRGFSPDTPLLVVGVDPRASAAVLVALLALPLVIAALRAGGVRALGAGGAGALLAVLFVQVGPRTDVDRAGAELRRMLDNFSPDAGNPILVDASSSWASSSSGASSSTGASGVGVSEQHLDPRVLLAVDRGRFAWPRLLENGCMLEEAQGARHPLVGAPAPNALLVVPDRLAPDLLALGAGTSMVVASTTDLRRHARAGLPCTGPIGWLDIGAPLPPALGGLRVLKRDGAMVWLERGGP